MDILAITSAYNALKMAKDVFAIVLESKIETETQAKVADAMQKVGEAQDTLFRLREELFQLQTENRELKDAFDERDAWKEKIGHYFLTETEGGAIVFQSKEDPKHYICPSCIERHKEFQILQDSRVISGAFKCPGCDKVFGVRTPGAWKSRKVINPGVT